MSRRTIFTACSLLLTLGALAPPVGAQGAPELFQSAQQHFQKEKWDDLLEDIEKLFEVAEGLPAAEQEQLVPPALFFRAAGHAMEKQEEAAIVDFQIYRLLVGGAELDENRFPKRIIKAFQESGHQRMDLGAAYEVYERLPLPADREPQHLVEGPLRRVLSSQEQSRLAALGDAAAIEAGILELLPSGSEGTLAEVEERMAFADLAFRAPDKPGCATDRGLVFALMGPPSYSREPMIKDNQSAAAHVGDSSSMGGSLRGGGAEVWGYRDARVPTYVEQKSFEINYEIDRSRGIWNLEKVGGSVRWVEGAAEALRDEGTLN